MSKYKQLDPEQIREEIKKKEQGILRELTKIEESSLNTIHNLQKQGEQLNRINNEVNNIHQNLAISERIVKKMSSIFSFFSSKPDVCKQVDGQKKDHDVDKHSLPKKNTSPKKDILLTNSNKTLPQASSSGTIKIVDNIDIMSAHLDNIKENTRRQSELINQHNDKLDSIVNNASSASNKIKKINKKIQRIT